MEWVNSCDYLGVKITNSGKIDEEILNRISQASKVYYSLNHTLINKKEVSKKVKLQVYNSMYKPTLTYASESWTMNTKHQSQIQAAEMRYLRRTAGKTKLDRVRNINIREELKQTPLTRDIENKQLRWYGHVNRMEKKRIPLLVMDAKTEGRRKRGRPRTTWLDSIGKAAAKRRKSMAEIKKLSRDRKKYREWLKEDPTP